MAIAWNIYISYMESSVNKQIHLNCLFFLHRGSASKIDTVCLQTNSKYLSRTTPYICLVYNISQSIYLTVERCLSGLAITAQIMKDQGLITHGGNNVLTHCDIQWPMWDSRLEVCSEKHEDTLSPSRGECYRVLMV